MADDPPIHTGAHHEAAHAVVGHLMGLPVASVDVFDHGAGLCIIDKTQIHTDPNDGAAIISTAFAMLVMSHAGDFALHRLGIADQYPSFRNSSDFKDSMAVVMELIDAWGDSIRVQRLLARTIQLSRIVVARVWPAIDSLAIELSEKKRLDGDYLQQRLVALVGPKPPLHLT